MPIHLMGCLDMGKWANEFVKAVEDDPSLPTNRLLMYEWFATVFYAGYDRRATENPYSVRRAIDG